MTQSLIGAAALINAVLVITGVIQIWQLDARRGAAGRAGSRSTCRRARRSSRSSSARERLMNAVALNNAGMNFSRVIGPSIAGALIALPFVGAGGGLPDRASVCTPSSCCSLLRIPQRGAPIGTKRPSPLRSLGDGLSYVHGNSGRLHAAVAGVRAGAAGHALPAADAGLRRRTSSTSGRAGLGLLLTVNGIGALIGSLTIASTDGFRRRGLLQMLLGIAFGLSVAALRFRQSFLRWCAGDVAVRRDCLGRLSVAQQHAGHAPTPTRPTTAGS